MKNYVRSGDEFEVTLTAAVNAGEVCLDGAQPGVAFNTGAIGDVVAIKTNGVFEFTSDGVGAFAPGDSVYWDDAAKDVTTTATGNTQIGVAFTAAPATVGAKVQVLMNGNPD